MNAETKATEQPFDAAQLRDRNTYPLLLQENVRPRDCDMQNHVNNAVYMTYFEIGRSVARRGLVPRPLPEGTFFVVARQTVDYYLPIPHPAKIEIGTGVLRIGRSSFTWAGAVFWEGRCAAIGECVMVLTDKVNVKPVGIPEDFRRDLEAGRLRRP